MEFAALPHYPSLASPLAAARGLAVALARFWRVLDDVDCVWLLGPHPLSLAFAVLARARRRRFAIGVRQDLPSYARNRHPGNGRIYAAARLLELAFRALGRRSSVVAIGDALAVHYQHARRLLVALVSLVSEAEVDSTPAPRSFDGPLRVLSVSRLDAEKNPLLLADVLERLRAGPGDWKLTVCGDGPLAGALAGRVAELGLDGAVELRGYVPVDGGLRDLYAQSHALLHVSWTEGMPQVLLEAFAARLPVVATDVGGVAAVAAGAALLVPPGDADAPARELRRLVQDAALRDQLVAAGVERVRGHTIERECARLAAFLRDA